MTCTAAPGPSGDPSVRLSDRVASITISGPSWRTCTFCAGRGRMRTGGRGGPFLPQPDAAAAPAARRTHRAAPSRNAPEAWRGAAEGTLQEVAGHVPGPYHGRPRPSDVGGVDL